MMLARGPADGTASTAEPVVAARRHLRWRTPHGASGTNNEDRSVIAGCVVQSDAPSCPDRHRCSVDADIDQCSAGLDEAGTHDPGSKRTRVLVEQRRCVLTASRRLGERIDRVTFAPGVTVDSTTGRSSIGRSAPGLTPPGQVTTSPDSVRRRQPDGLAGWVFDGAGPQTDSTCAAAHVRVERRPRHGRQPRPASSGAAATGAPRRGVSALGRRCRLRAGVGAVALSRRRAA